MLDQSVCCTLYGVANSYEQARETLTDSVIIQTYQSLRWTNMSRSRGGTGGPDPLGINKDNRVFSDQLVAIRPWVSSVHQSDHDHTKHMCTENP